jgi:DNA-binding CsgD family transcriptional regulator
MLSKREKEVLILVCEEFSSSQIAAKLNLSIGTVYTHRKNILHKVGVKNTVGLVKFAMRKGILS